MNRRVAHHASAGRLVLALSICLLLTLQSGVAWSAYGTLAPGSQGELCLSSCCAPAVTSEGRMSMEGHLAEGRVAARLAMAALDDDCDCSMEDSTSLPGGDHDTRASANHRQSGKSLAAHSGMIPGLILPRPGLRHQVHVSRVFATGPPVWLASCTLRR